MDLKVLLQLNWLQFNWLQFNWSHAVNFLQLNLEVTTAL